MSMDDIDELWIRKKNIFKICVGSFNCGKFIDTIHISIGQLNYANDANSFHILQNVEKCGVTYSFKIATPK